MDVFSLIGGIVGGAIGGSALAKVVLDTAKDRWMESVKAEGAAELEKLKDSLEGTQKALQTRLDRGTHVTQAQYDLELSSYKELWFALSALRERWRSYFVPYTFVIEGKEAPWLQGAVEEATKALFAAHDAAVLVIGNLAPFYEKGIQTASRATTVESYTFLQKVNEWNNAAPAPHGDEANARLQTIVDGIENIDDLIRHRLISLRLV